MLEKIKDDEYYALRDLIEEASSRRDKEVLKNLRYTLMTEYEQNRDTEYLLDLIKKVL